MIENLHTLRGRDCEIAKGIILRQPKLSEIEELGEEKYSGMLAILVSSPFDMIAELDKLNIDFTKITSFQLFCVFYKLLDVKETKLLFGDLDFSKFRLIENNGKFELRFFDTVINEKIYKEIVDGVRTINALSPPQYTRVANEYTKQKMIELAYSEMELSKRRKPKSILKTLISRATNHPYFKYKLDEVWDMSVYAFYDALKSINIIENSNHLSIGAYSGNIDTSKINKKEFNWLREA